MSEPQDKPLLIIDMVTDPVCPWCYVGKRSLDRVMMALSFSHQVEVRYRPYQLNPDLAEAGTDRKALMAAKFTDKEKFAAMQKALDEAGRGVGLVMDREKPTWQPNTLHALRLMRWSHIEECQSEMKEALCDAFWNRGENIGDKATLAKIAARCGMDEAEILAQLESDEDLEDVKQEAAAFRQAGVSGVPTFIVNEKVGFSGALPPDQLLGAIRQIIAETAAAD